ncbi:armadillo-like helical domain-containing protein 4 isoform X2 [Kryptolebias marmoratus]|uniref:armadillo-like helical domain-containing protein 4 isoform X2 n=1 Tax=Kryptolebias marmoratus TaxID=37003 RepID=UPI000D530C2D|nr:armadillo-like helical domain-containing protein 4 isoform X2 [Kryptolebias marmoratus]
MPTSWLLRGLLLLLLAGTCLRLHGAPTHLPNFNHMQDGSCEGHCPSLVTTAVLAHTAESVLLDKEHITGSVLNVGAGGGTGPHGEPEGIESVMQTENGDSLHGRFGPSEAGGEAQSQRREGKQIESASEEEDAERQNKEKPVDDETASPTGGRDQGDAERGTRLSFPDSESSDPYSPLWTQKVASSSPIPSLMFAPPRTSAPLAVWGRDGAPVPSPSDPILPEMGPNMMSRDDGLESLWTEAARPAGDTAVPLTQDDATEATMSSEALPLIFEPFEDVVPKGRAAQAFAQTAAGAQSPVATATRRPSQLVTAEADSDGPSRGPPALLSDWTSPWLTSGSELLELVGSSGPPASQRRVGTEPEDRKAAARTPNFEGGVASAGPSLSSLQHAMTTVTLATHQLLHKDSEEEPDEEDDDENSEESMEDESEEDVTGTPKASSTQPPYSLIPPPPVWVQRNQGLMRSWLELIRQKAGYVSGMLAPVGIGITGALLIVGALYSIRVIHRKRRNSFKHQRRKARQPEQPREPGASCQDQAMLLADSSEDEF